MPLTVEDAYRNLGLDPTATEQQVKTAYKKFALLNHPDKAKPEEREEAHKRFILISESYKRITDPDSFKDEEDHEPSEEEMQAMFNSMFAEMLGGGGFGGGFGIPLGMFDVLEAMMMNDMAGGGAFPFGERDEDGDDDDDDDYGGGGIPFMGGAMEAFLLSQLMEEEESRHRKGSRRKEPRQNMKQASKAVKNNKSNASATTSRTKKPQAKPAPSSKMPTAVGNDDDAEWETDEEENRRPARGNGYGRHPMYFEEDGDDDDDNDDDDLDGMNEAAMLYMMLNGMAGELGDDPGGMSFFDFGGGGGGRGRNGKSPAKSKKNAKAKAKAKAMDNEAAAKSSAAEAVRSSADFISDEPKVSSKGSKGGNASKPVPDFPSSSSKKSAPKSSDKIQVGDRVIVSNRYLGTVGFVGEVHYAKGIMAGVVMDDPAVGKNNGVIRGVKYFDCNGRNLGLMTALSDLTRA